MKKIKKTLIIMVAFIMMFGYSLNMNKVYAASFGVGTSSTVVAPGGNITVYISGLANHRGSLRISASNGTVTGPQLVFARGDQSLSTTVSAGNSGVVTITVTAVDLATMDEVDHSGEVSSVNVTIQNPNPGGGSSGGSSGGSGGNTGGNSGGTNTPDPSDERSSNNSLSNISLSKGNLNPEFNADVTSYKVDLPADANEIELGATPADDKATISGIGKKNLKAGKNQFEIICKAENDSTRTYSIEIYVDEKPLVFLTHHKQKLGFVRNLDGLEIPKGFIETTLKVKDKEVVAWKNDVTKQVLVYLINEKNEKNFYLYHNQIVSIYKPIMINGRNFIQIEVPKNIQTQAGLIFKKVMIDENQLDGWKFEENQFKNYTLLYLMDESGKTSFYQYESTEKSIQKYSNAAAATQDKFNETQELKNNAQLWRNIFIGMTITLIIGISALGFYTMKLVKLNKKA